MEFSPEAYGLMQTLFGSIGVVISLLFGFYLLFVVSKKKPAYIFLGLYFILFGIRIGKSLFFGYYRIDNSYLVVFLGLLLAIGPSLWLFNKNLDAPDFRFKISHDLFHFLPFLLVFAFSKTIPVNGEPYSWLFHIGLFAHGMVYAYLTLYNVSKDGKNRFLIKETEHNRWLIVLSVATMIMFIHYLLVYFNVIPYYPTGAFLFSFLVVLLCIWVIKTPSFFKGMNQKYVNSTLNKEEVNMLYNRLCKLMKEEKLYLDPELSLSSLSDYVGITSKELSQVINQGHNQNYSQFVARYRIEEAKKLLRAKKYKDYKISSVAYESGFNNLSSFNVAFKKYTNTTAVKFRDAIKAL